ncbi:MAG: hypothetical protein ACK5MY_02630 [Jhaorihella sp.]
MDLDMIDDRLWKKPKLTNTHWFEDVIDNPVWRVNRSYNKGVVFEKKRGKRTDDKLYARIEAAHGAAAANLIYDRVRNFTYSGASHTVKARPNFDVSLISYNYETERGIEVFRIMDTGHPDGFPFCLAGNDKLYNKGRTQHLFGVAALEAERIAACYEFRRRINTHIGNGVRHGMIYDRRRDRVIPPYAHKYRANILERESLLPKHQTHLFFMPPEELGKVIRAHWMEMMGG